MVDADFNDTDDFLLLMMMVMMMMMDMGVL